MTTGIERLRRIHTRIFTQGTAGDANPPLCNLALIGSLLLGGAFTRTGDILVDVATNNTFITFNVFLGPDAAFRSYNTANKAAPAFQGVMVAGVDHNSFSHAVLSGTTVFAASAVGGIWPAITSIDISNPLVPARISNLDRPGVGSSIGGVSLVGTNLYVVDGASISFSIIDVANPAVMTITANYVGGIDFPIAQGSMERITVIGATAYILSYDQFTPEALLGIYDVTLPLAVTQTSVLQVSIPSGAAQRRCGLEVLGNLAYCVVDDEFIIVDVSIPVTPVILSTTALTADNVSTATVEARPLTVNAAQTRAYILNRQQRTVTVYNIADLTVPLLMSITPTQATSSPQSITLTSNDFAFIAETEQPAGSTQGWLEIFDTSGCV